MDSYFQSPEGRQRALELLANDEATRRTLEMQANAEQAEKQRKEAAALQQEEAYKANVERARAQNPAAALLGDGIHGEKLSSGDKSALRKQVDDAKAALISSIPEVQEKRELLQAKKEELARINRMRNQCTNECNAIIDDLNAIKKQHENTVDAMSITRVVEQRAHAPAGDDAVQLVYVYKGIGNEYAVALCGCKILFPIKRLVLKYEYAWIDYSNVLHFHRCWLHEDLYPINHTQAWQTLCANMKDQGAPILRPMWLSTDMAEPGLLDCDKNSVIVWCKCPPCIEIKRHRDDYEWGNGSTSRRLNR